MDESAIQPRLEAIERRQYYILSLLVGGYIVAGTCLLVSTVTAVTVWNAGFGLLVLAVLVSMVGFYRRRQANS